MVKSLAPTYRYSANTMLQKYSIMEMQLPDWDKGTWVYTCMCFYYTKCIFYLCVNFSENLVGQNSGQSSKLSDIF